MGHLRHVIVGASAAGIAAAEAIRTVDRISSLTVVAAETEEPYARIFLPRRLSEELPVERLAMRRPGLWARLGATALLGHTAAGLDTERREVLLGDGARLPYDRLLIATGASPQLPCVAGSDLVGISGLRTWADAARIAAWLSRAHSALIVGAGLVSLKALQRLTSRGLALTVVAASGQVLSQLLDPAPALAVRARMEARGIGVLVGASVTRFEGRGHVERAVLTTGAVVPCDVVLIGKGVTPNVEWLAESGVQVAGGVPVDEHCCSNVPDVYAAGDVAVAHDLARGGARLNATWPNAVAQGRVAGLNMAGQPALYDGSLSLSIGSFFGLPVAAVGVSQSRGEAYEARVLSADGERYRKLVLHEGQIAGALLSGDVQPAGALQSLIRRRARLADWEALLGRRRFSLPAHLACLGRAPCEGASAMSEPARGARAPERV